MKLSDEHEFLLSSVKRWFEKPDQIFHYANELTVGVTAAEQYLLGELPNKGTVLDVGCGVGRVIGFKVLCYIPTKKLRQIFLQQMYRVLRPGGICVMTQNIVPDEFIDEAEDEHFKISPASNFEIIEKGDTLPMGEGYVHWFTEHELLNEISHTHFEVEIFKSDEEFGGERCGRRHYNRL